MSEKTLTIDEFVDTVLAQELDHAAFLRRCIKDNLEVSRAAKLLITEVDRLRADLDAAARKAPSIMAFSIRRILNASLQRMHSATTPPPSQVIS